MFATELTDRSAVARVNESRADEPSGASVHEAVAAAVKIVCDSGLPNRTDSMSTIIEGEWDEVFDVIHQASDAVSAYGKRVDLVLNADIRPGRSDELNGKLERLEQAIVDQPGPGHRA